MHSFLHFLAASTPSTTAKGTKHNSASSTYFLIIIALFAVVYLFFIRPRSQRARQQRTAGNQINVGDEVMSAGGIYGRVVAIDADVVEVEVSPGVVMNFTRRAISPRQGTTPGGSAPGGSAPAPTGQAAGPASDDWDTPPAVQDQGTDQPVTDVPQHDAPNGQRPETSGSQHPEGDDASGPEPGGTS
jgi:preprotein translocase subunit YajC